MSYSDSGEIMSESEQKHPILVSIDSAKKNISEARDKYSTVCNLEKQHRYIARQYASKANAIAEEIRALQEQLEHLEESWRQAQLNKITEEKFLPLVNQYLADLVAAGSSVIKRQQIQLKYDKLGLPLSLVIEYLEKNKKE